MNVVGFNALGADGIFSGTQLWVVGRADIVPLMLVDTAAIGLMLVFVLSPAGRNFGPGGFYYTRNAFAH